MKNFGVFETRLSRQSEQAQLEEKLRFFDACETVRRGVRDGGIGTLRERTLHAALKLYFEEDPKLHEQNVAGSVADIRNEYGLIEIQTVGLSKLRPKLERFLETTDDRIIIVHPIAAEKRLLRLDGATGELSRPRKSPKKGSFLSAYRELYGLCGLIAEPRISILLMLIDMDEYSLRVGPKKRHSSGLIRYERIPTALRDFVLLRTAEDHADLIPDDLPEVFTVKQFAASAKLTQYCAQSAITVLSRVGAITDAGRRGRAKLYRSLSRH